MKYIDFSELLEGDPAHIAFLSTFQFDPDFFERRLFRSATLSKARRIIVFLDARQWFELLRRDVPARWLNRRYLVAPVHRVQGVFHPKLSLLLSESGGQVLCGSNNLTRAGCTSNLELLNSVRFTFDGSSASELDVAREAFRFFEQAVMETDDEIARIASEWINETRSTFTWLKEAPTDDKPRSVRLLSTYDGSIWERLIRELDGKEPKEFFVISPFHDADSSMCRRLSELWPRATIELLVQQGYTNLAVEPLRKLRNVNLSELLDFSRRIHAKLIAWRTESGMGCVVGSANFTSAALDGRNVETSLLISNADKFIEGLFDREFKKRPLAFDEFVPGDADEPESDLDLPELRIGSAVLSERNEIHLSYSDNLQPKSTSLRLQLRTPGETRPRTSLPVPVLKTSATVVLPENALAEANGTLLATLVAESGGRKVESLPIWVIQENRLTYEPGEGSSSSKSKVEDTGEGLPEYLDELGARDGKAAIIEYLKRLNIRFQDGGGKGPGQRKFRLKLRDPFQADIAPEWLLDLKGESDDLEQAIYDFADRHEKRRLHKHAGRGNINGMENFLDIFTTLVRLLYVYYKRGVTKRGKLIGRYCKYLQLATLGSDSENDACDGYLYSLYDSLSGDVDLLQQVCDETNYLAEVRALLVIVQCIRFDPNETPMYDTKANRPREVLKKYSQAVTEAIRECGLQEPTRTSVQKALESYQMFTADEIAKRLDELPGD